MNPPQRLQWERLRMTKMNALDGPRVAEDLERNEPLWDAFLFGRFHPLELIELRDLPEGFLNADTLYLLTTRQRSPELLRLAEGWDGEVSWHANDHPGFSTREEFQRKWGAPLDKDQVVIQVWWD